MRTKEQHASDECICLISEVDVVLPKVDPGSQGIEEEEGKDVEMGKQGQGGVEGDGSNLVAVLDRRRHSANAVEVKAD